MKYFYHYLLLCFTLLLQGCSNSSQIIELERYEKVESVFFSGDKIYILGQKTDFVSPETESKKVKKLQQIFTKFSAYITHFDSEVSEYSSGPSIQANFRFDTKALHDKSFNKLLIELGNTQANKNVKLQSNKEMANDLKSSINIKLQGIQLDKREELIQQYPVSKSRFRHISQIYFAEKTRESNINGASETMGNILGIITAPIWMPAYILMCYDRCSIM